jgi:NTE family protein
MTKFLISLFGATLVAGCAGMHTRHSELGDRPADSTVPSSLAPSPESSGNKNPISISQVNMPPLAPVTTTPAPALARSKDIPNGESARIGLLLGPGGLRAYAHVGVIQEFVKAKTPIVAVAGLEMGALVGGIFANKGQTYDVEWQMSKLHEEDFVKKSLMTSSKPQDITVLKGFLQKALGSGKAEDSKLPFACPAFQIAKRQVYMMSRGPFASMLEYCLPFSPLFRPFEQNVAALTSISAAVQFLRSKGANYIVYVDLLGEKKTPFFADADSNENISWSLVEEDILAQLYVVNKIVPVSLQGFNLNDFSKRRDMIQRGQDAGRAASRELQTELGL